MTLEISGTILQCVCLILSRRFVFRPEPSTRVTPSQALVVTPVLIQWSVSCMRVIYIYNTYIKNGKSCTTARRKFRRKYPNRPLISKNTILRLVNRFNETGSFNDRVRKQTRRILTEAKIAEISAALHGSPRKSLRCLAQQTGVCEASAGVATKLLKLKPYRIPSFHELQPSYYNRRLHFSNWMLEKVNNENG